MSIVVSADTGAREYMIYRAVVSWEDVGGYYAAHTAPEWGRYGCRYLKVEEGCMYGRLFMSACAEPWWYMVPVHDEVEVLTRGGWAPPSAFAATRYSWFLDRDDVPVPPLLQYEWLLYEDEVPTLPPRSDILVYVGGAVDDRHGIAASFVLQGPPMGSSSCMSLALPGFTGAEISGLFGITLGLLGIVTLCHFHSSAVLRTCDRYVIEHVFKGANPVDGTGQVVWPAIWLARLLIGVAEDFGISVSVEEVPFRENPAPRQARDEIEYRRGRGWSDEDRWFYDAAFKSVFLCVSRNCGCAMLDLPPFFGSDEVSRACNDFYLDLDGMLK